MGQKTKWVKAGDQLHKVPEVAIPEDQAIVLAARKDGQEGPAVVDASRFVPSVHDPDGSFLGRSHDGPDAAWVIAKLACGDKGGGCGCGCNEKHAVTVLSAEGAVEWLVVRGVPGPLYPDELKPVAKRLLI